MNIYHWFLKYKYLYIFIIISLFIILIIVPKWFNQYMNIDKNFNLDSYNKFVEYIKHTNFNNQVMQAEIVKNDLINNKDLYDLFEKLNLSIIYIKDNRKRVIEFSTNYSIWWDQCNDYLYSEIHSFSSCSELNNPNYKTLHEPWFWYWCIKEKINDKWNILRITEDCWK